MCEQRLKKKSLLLTKGTYIKSGTGTQRGEKRRWILVNQLYLELKLTKLPKTKTYPSKLRRLLSQLKNWAIEWQEEANVSCSVSKVGKK